MTPTGYRSAAFAGVLLALASMPCMAANFHSYISASGNDMNPCTLTSPCLMMQRGVDQTVAGGVLSCLSASSPGSDFGAVTITTSITIDCEGFPATPKNIVVNAVGITVTLRHLVINGQGIGFPGIDFQSGASLFVESCTIERWQAIPGIAINFAPSASFGQLVVTDTIIKNNGNAGPNGGILIRPTGTASVRAVIERTVIANNNLGLLVDGSGSSGRTVAEINNSLVAMNIGNGITVNNAGLVINRTSVQGNSGNGVLAGPSALIHLGASTVAANFAGGLAYNGGQIFSYQNNQTKGNGTDNAPSGVLTLD